MSIIKEGLDGKADRHETGGGTCKTIKIGSHDVKVCLDENGEIIEESFREFAKLTGQ